MSVLVRIFVVQLMTVRVRCPVHVGTDFGVLAVVSVHVGTAVLVSILFPVHVHVFPVLRGCRYFVVVWRGGRSVRRSVVQTVVLWIGVVVT